MSELFMISQPSTRAAKPEKEWLSRKEAAVYLTGQGYRIETQTLANLAANNNAKGGPPFTRSGWKAVRYKKTDLDAWAQLRSKHVV
jgi:uncharacterized protein YjhX (UPF0386 family)